LHGSLNIFRFFVDQTLFYEFHLTYLQNIPRHKIYNVDFDRPTPIPVLVRATVKGTALVDPIAATKQAILDHAAGNMDGENGLQVDTDVSPFELSAAVNAFAPGIFVTKMEVAYDAMVPVYLTDTLPIALNEIASITEANIQVIVL